MRLRQRIQSLFGWCSDLLVGNALVMLLPATLALTAVFLFPLGLLGLNSLHLSEGLGTVGTAYSLENYHRFISDTFYLQILGRTFYLGIIVVIACVICAYPVAYCIARTRSRWRGALVFAVVCPLLISVVIRNLGWIPILGENGMINWVLITLGLTQFAIPLSNNFTAVAIGLTHSLLPFMILSLVTVIGRIDPAIEEASINLGAGPIRTFFRVVWPLSRPGLLAGGLIVFTLAISAYTTPAMLGGKRVLVMPTYIAQQMLTVLDYAIGSTAAVILMVVTIGLTLVSLRTHGER